ncbi:Translation initiation factor IF-2 [Patescibacteria group bacterium]|nr:translation initiation factor IF-2 [Candidatus Dojkabacteria bacterium]CAG1021513.1 Translation initiation factor IF-2 [Patescibacteria group bacterium]
MPKIKSEVKTEATKVRTPIVAVMGHVDHGKTSFLDAIRGTRVAAKEAGGITQNTRAHEVVTKSGFRITFIDTPGHEAFGNMRSRGAKVTDFVLLIVAADDGVQPQTKQSIEFAKRDNVPVIVAINKIDIKGINLQKVKTELSSFGVVAEEYGGDTLFFEISAKEKIGLEELLEGIQLLSEVHELKSAKPKEGILAEAFILESSLDKQIGNVALCILKAGNLNDKVFGVSKEGYFKVRTYLDHNQNNINKVEESQPFWVTGLRATLPAGDTLYFVETEDKAKELVKELTVEEETRVEQEKSDAESLFAQMLIKREEIKQGIEEKKLNVIVKASTEGTLEAILEKLKEIKNDEAVVNILDSGTGNVTEDEINRAKLAKAIIVTFQLPTPNKIGMLAKNERVLVRNYEVIYEMFDEVEEVLNGMSEPTSEEVEIARAKIKQVFTLSDGSTVYGAEVTKGLMLKGYRIKIERNVNNDIYELGRGKITSLRIKKEEVREVKKGLDCGIVMDGKAENVEAGDDIVAYKVETSV